MNARDPVVASLRKRIDEALDPHLPADIPVALVDFPNHPNAGDSAIWLGEVAYLRARGIEVRYTCNFASYSERLLAKRLGEGTILLHGGGSLGDVWEETQRFRERVVASFPTHKIVQLPQTVHFREESNLERTRAVFDAHPNLTLLARDRRSLELASSGFQTPSGLCPDMAFMLGALERPRQPAHDVLWLSRTDAESKHSVEGVSGPPVQQADWLEQSRREAPWAALRWATQVASRRIKSNPGLAPALSGGISRLQDPLARQRVRAGSELLSTGRVVITDRLHGHILCLLLDIPHVILDNTYGKLSTFYETWTSGCAIAQWADSAAEALALAVELARDVPRQ